MTSIPWTTVENAVVAWLEGSTGLRAAWDYEGGTSLPSPYVSVQISGYRPVGHDWRTFAANPTPSPGQELVASASGMRQATLILQVYGEPRRGQSPAVSPLPLLAQAIDALALYVDSLDLAGVGIGDIGPVSMQGAGAIVTPRARCEIGIHLASTVEGVQTSLDYVKITTRVNDDDQMEVETWIPSDPPP